MKVSKGRSQPEIVVAAFLILYMVLGRPFFVPGFDYDSAGNNSVNVKLTVAIAAKSEELGVFPAEAPSTSAEAGMCVLGNL